MKWENLLHLQPILPALLTSAFGQEASRTHWDKAAALLHSFATTQTLIDGNKRTAWAASWLFLRLNGAVTKLQGRVDPDLGEKFVLDIAKGQKDIPEIADGLQRFVYPQLGKYGYLPSGSQITSIWEYNDGLLTGIGTLPDGTTLIYQYLILSDGTPMEIVLTPTQARNFAKGLIGIVDGNPDYQNEGANPISRGRNSYP